MLPLVAIFVIFYFLLIRPQQKKAKEHKALLASVRRGDRVVTGGGILGVVTKVVRRTSCAGRDRRGRAGEVCVKSTIADIPSRTAAGASASATRRSQEDEADEEADDEFEAAETRETTKS